MIPDGAGINQMWGRWLKRTLVLPHGLIPPPHSSSLLQIVCIYNVLKLLFRKGRIVGQTPLDCTITSGRSNHHLWSCLDINIWFMPWNFYNLKAVDPFLNVLKMMNIILHIPLLISHVFMYQASGYIIIYIAGVCTKKIPQQPPRKSKHIWAKPK